LIYNKDILSFFEFLIFSLYILFSFVVSIGYIHHHEPGKGQETQDGRGKNEVKDGHLVAPFSVPSHLPGFAPVLSTVEEI